MFLALMLSAALIPHFSPRVVLEAPVVSAKPCEPGTTRLVADPQRSAIRWKGTKFMGLGSHEGTIALQTGEVCMRQSRIVRALFVADMRSLDITDIPATDPVPRKRLRDHLVSEDFFHVARHPNAVLFINDVRQENQSLYRVNGTLTMRGVTHPVTFYARIQELSPARVRADATLELDRHRWGISYRGSKLKDDLVDDEFTMHLTLFASARPAVSQ